LDNVVRRYYSSTGAFSNVVATTSLQQKGLAWDAAGNLYVGLEENQGSGPSRIARYGPASQEAFTVSLDSASAVPVSVSYATTDGSATAGSDYTAVTSGTVFFAPGETSKTILIQTVDDAVIELPETFNVTLSDPVAATIANGQGAGTILDNDTKFYVVNDGATDKT
jgi:hypothetical protein